MIDEMIRRLRMPYPASGDLRRGIVLTGAAEQMFVFNAPLAHVVAYENWQRDQRLRRTYWRQARRSGLALPPLALETGI